jgi:hypothetical protein
MKNATFLSWGILLAIASSWTPSIKGVFAEKVPVVRVIAVISEYLWANHVVDQVIKHYEKTLRRKQLTYDEIWEYHIETDKRFIKYTKKIEEIRAFFAKNKNKIDMKPLKALDELLDAIIAPCIFVPRC